MAFVEKAIYPLDYILVYQTDMSDVFCPVSGIWIIFFPNTISAKS